MSTVYLYVKQHSITGLKYFGKTIKDPYIYKGSGKYWLKHISKHGRDKVVTLQVWKFSNLEEATEFALKFSLDNNIVESNEWANLMLENGINGGAVENNYFKIFNKLPRTKSHGSNISKSKKGKATKKYPVMVNNIVYESYAEASRIIGVSDQTWVAAQWVRRLLMLF